MSNEKFETDIPKIVLEKEDREAFQRTRQQSTGKSTPPVDSDSSKGKSSGASSFLVFLVFLIAAGASGASYWLYEQKLQQDKALNDAEQRILELERRLSATGEEMDQSAVALQVKVTELSEKTETLWGEMDKLWASAWRKNQSEIKALDKSVKVQGSNLSKQFSALESDVISGTTNLAVIQEQLDGQLGKSQEMARSIQEVALSGNGMNQLIEDLQAKVVAADKINSSLTKRIADLEKWRRTLPAPVRPKAPSVGGTPGQSGSK